MANSKRYTFRILTESDQEIVDAFLEEHKHIDLPSFIRSVVFDAIFAEQNRRLEKVINEINENQRAHGAPEI